MIFSHSACNNNELNTKLEKLTESKKEVRDTIKKYRFFFIPRGFYIEIPKKIPKYDLAIWNKTHVVYRTDPREYYERLRKSKKTLFKKIEDVEKKKLLLENYKN